MKNLKFLKSNLISHRGLYDNKKVYENTLDAFREAIKHNYIIELDVRLLKDDVAIIYHDSNTERLLHIDEDISKMSYGDLKYISDIDIPTLGQALEVINVKVPVIIELKGKVKKYKLEKLVSDLLENYHGIVAIQSFEMKTVKWFYKKHPEYPVGILINKADFIRDYFFKSYDFMNINISLYDIKKIRSLRENKIVLGYGVKTKKDLMGLRTTYDNLVCDNLLEIDAH